MANLKTNYKNDVLDASKNIERVYDIMSRDGNVLQSNVIFRDKSVYTQIGDEFGAGDINGTNEQVNYVVSAMNGLFEFDTSTKALTINLDVIEE